MTQVFRFTLTYRLPEGRLPDEYLDALFEAGCGDCLPGTGLAGHLGLDFSRSAATAATAIDSAIADVERAIPEAILVEIGPDLVGISDVAMLTGCTRQNVRKHMDQRDGPSPAHFGSTALWHLAQLGPWLEANTPLRLEAGTLDVAAAAFERNLLRKLPHLPKPEQPGEFKRSAYG